MSVRVLEGDCRAILPALPAESVHCVVTSPPYWGLRDYGVAGQLGLEPAPEAYVAAMVDVFRAVRRVLRDDGTLWLNMGDSYAGSWGNQGRKEERGTQRPINGGMLTPVHDGRYPDKGSNTGAVPDGYKPKDLVGMPWRLAVALQADGWYLRADIIWAKPNPMPESVTDRPTKAHEYIFLLTKRSSYFYDADAVREPASENSHGALRGDPGWKARTTGNHSGPLGLVADSSGRNLRSVWTIPSAPFPGAHFATFPPALASRCIQAGTSEKGCCAACAAPWERQTETSYVKPSAGAGYSGRTAEGVNGWYGAGLPRLNKQTTTTGWQPSCACDAAVMPCTVLDPFGGSGTVGAVAEQLGRHSILIELSAPYVAMAKQRTAQMGLFAQEAG